MSKGGRAFSIMIKKVSILLLVLGAILFFLIKYGKVISTEDYMKDYFGVSDGILGEVNNNDPRTSSLLKRGWLFTALNTGGKFLSEKEVNNLLSQSNAFEKEKGYSIIEDNQNVMKIFFKNNINNSNETLIEKIPVKTMFLVSKNGREFRYAYKVNKLKSSLEIKIIGSSIDSRNTYGGKTLIYKNGYMYLTHNNRNMLLAIKGRSGITKKVITVEDSKSNESKNILNINEYHLYINLINFVVSGSEKGRDGYYIKFIGK